MNFFWTFLLLSYALGIVVCAPVDGKAKVASDKDEGKEMDDLGLEYGRYLQQVVQALEEDKDFAKKLENISTEQIRSGQIAKELEFVKHNIRSKLDELKRMEVDRLRKLVQEQMERTELGLYRDEDGHLLGSPDGRRWRSIPGHQGGSEGGVGGGGDFWLGMNRKGIKLPLHVDVNNPHSFEIDDLKKLIQTATKDLEALDQQRREEFKKYEMEKELSYRESLQNMTEEQRNETVKHHKEMVQKHKDHPKVHHPGSKPQLEDVWEGEDHMPRNEFNPRTFFAMHDVNGDGHLDENEIEAILIPEVKKMYDPRNEEDDPTEMEEEYHRMREHIFNETDKNKDGLISMEEFIRMTEQQEFEKDDGWKGLDEEMVYSEAELQEFMRQRQAQMGMQYQPYYGDPQRTYYDVQNAQHGLPPQINYQVPHNQGLPPQQQHYPGMPPQQQHYPGMPQQQQQQHYQQPPPHFQGGAPPQQFQGGYPQQQFHGGSQQQQFHGGSQQFHDGSQQFHNAQPQQQQFGGVHQQTQLQGVPPQPQFQGGQHQKLGSLSPQTQDTAQAKQSVQPIQPNQPQPNMQLNALPQQPLQDSSQNSNQAQVKKKDIPSPSVSSQQQHPPQP